eukprot:7388571-Prymnesium_polylepis.1
MATINLGTSSDEGEEGVESQLRLTAPVQGLTTPAAPGGSSSPALPSFKSSSKWLPIFPESSSAARPRANRKDVEDARKKGFEQAESVPLDHLKSQEDIKQ